MSTLNIDSFEPINISDYQELNYDLIVFFGKSDYDWLENTFIPFYEDHLDDKDSFNYSIDGNSYHGRFGKLLYDISGNYNFFMTTKPVENSGFVGWVSTDDVAYLNLIKHVQIQHERTNQLINLMLNKGLIDENDLITIDEKLPLNNDLDLRRRVTDLHKYLESTQGTIQDLRNED